MSNLTQQQIESEFARQVKLCQGIGKAKMKEILNDFFATLSHNMNISPEVRERMKSDRLKIEIRETLKNCRLWGGDGDFDDAVKQLFQLWQEKN